MLAIASLTHSLYHWMDEIHMGPIKFYEFISLPIRWDSFWKW